MVQIKIIKENCPYCDQSFNKEYPIIEYDNKPLNKKNNGSNIIKINPDTTQEYKIAKRKYVKQIENYVNHLLNTHGSKVNDSLNKQLGINHEDLK